MISNQLNGKLSTFKLNQTAFTNEIPARTNVNDPGPTLIATPLISRASACNRSSPHESNASRVRNEDSQLSTVESKTTSRSRPSTTRYTFDDDSIARSKLIPAFLNFPRPVASAPPSPRV